MISLAPAWYSTELVFSDANVGVMISPLVRYTVTCPYSACLELVLVVPVPFIKVLVVLCIASLDIAVVLVFVVFDISRIPMASVPPVTVFLIA